MGVTPHDPASFALACSLVTMIALLASTIPASQAARTNSIAILHSLDFTLFPLVRQA
ncbi:MAG: hypothetical protein WCC26_11715 [Terracidiphilus sp.]